MTDILVRRKWSAPEIAKSAEHQRRVSKSAASFIDDLVALKKSICLCAGCRRKFDARRHKYRVLPKYAYVISNCDACRAMGPGTLYLHYEAVQQLESVKDIEAARVRRNRLAGG